MPDATKILYEMELAQFKAKNPENPYPESFVKRRKTSKASGLQQAIIKFLQLQGHQCERVSVTGRMVDQRKTYKDVLGCTRQIGSVKYIKSSMQKGSADLSATLMGKSVKIEVKIGNDRQRPEQAEYQRQVERAGGVYVIIKTLDQFLEWYNDFMSNNKTTAV